jgi:hypothetical protein
MSSNLEAQIMNFLLGSTLENVSDLSARLFLLLGGAANNILCYLNFIVQPTRSNFVLGGIHERDIFETRCVQLLK